MLHGKSSLFFCRRFYLQAKQDEERLIKNRQITKDVKTTYVRFFLSLSDNAGLSLQCKNNKEYSTLLCT